jgi:hypothetical protein
MDAKLDPHADLDRLGGDVLDPTHQPKALVAINEGDIVGGTFARMRHRCRIDRAEPGADPPFEPIAAAKRTNDAGVIQPSAPSPVPSRRRPILFGSHVWQQGLGVLIEKVERPASVETTAWGAADVAYGRTGLGAGGLYFEGATRDKRRGQDR